MKKTLLTLVAIGCAVSAMAQGTLNFVNYVETGAGIQFLQAIYGPQVGDPGSSMHGSSAIDTPSGTTPYTGPLLQGTQYRAELWGGPSSITDPSLLAFVTFSTFFTDSGNNIPAGIFVPTGGTVAGVTAGNPAKLEVRVFDLQSGATYALAGVKGSSGLFLSGNLGGTDAGGGIVLPPDTTGWTSFNIASAVPEPSTFALAGLGAAALLIFRRRK